MTLSDELIRCESCEHAIEDGCGCDCCHSDWDWALPISENYLVCGRVTEDGDQLQLKCAECGLLYSVGEIELWELALDAKRHHDVHHADQEDESL